MLDRTPSHSLSGNKQVICATYVSTNKNIIFATEESQLFSYDTTNKGLQGPLFLKGKPTCIKTFDSIADFIFLGIDQMSISNPGSFGQQPGI